MHRDAKRPANDQGSPRRSWLVIGINLVVQSLFLNAFWFVVAQAGFQAGWNGMGERLRMNLLPFMIAPVLILVVSAPVAEVAYQASRLFRRQPRVRIYSIFSWLGVILLCMFLWQVLSDVSVTYGAPKNVALAGERFVKNNAMREGPLSLGSPRFNPLPTLPYESTSLEQDEWFVIARSLQGDGAEVKQLEACEELINDPTTTPELRRWATLREIELYTYTARENKALEIGRRWLRKHRDDPDPLAIRVILAEIVAQRRHEDFQPSLLDFERTFWAIFRNHDPLEWEVIRAHIEYAKWVTFYAPPEQPLLYAYLHARSMRHVGIAEKAILERNQKPDLSEAERQAGLYCINHEIRPLRQPPTAEDPELHQQALHLLEEMKERQTQGRAGTAGLDCTLLSQREQIR